MLAARPSTAALFVCTAFAVLTACFSSPAAVAADSASTACTAEVRERRTRELRIFRETMMARRKAFFRSHASRRLRQRYVQRQNNRIATLRAASAECSSDSGAALTGDDPAERPEACAPHMFGVSGAEMNEATFNSALSLKPLGTLRAVMLFVDFRDRPASESTVHLYDRLVKPAAAWFKEVSSGRATLDVTAVHRWYRMPSGSRGYGLGDGVSFVEQKSYIADAVAAADRDVDFSSYSIVYVVASRGSALQRSPAFHAFAGSGVQVDGTELRYGATFGEDVRDVSPPAYGSFVLVHETGHILGLPDLYDVPNPTYWTLFRFAGGWDMMSWNLPGSHLLAWHKWKLGWLHPSELTCLNGPGELTATLTPAARPGGLKGIVVPTGSSSAFVIEARKRVGEDSRLCEDGVLVYSVDGTVKSGEGPIRVRAAQRDTSSELLNRCGPLYEAPFDKGAGEVAYYDNPSAGFSLEVLGQTASGGYTVRVTRRSGVSPSGLSSALSGSGAAEQNTNETAPVPSVLYEWPYGLSGPQNPD
ncbi:MAG TPA: M6 family metalloprotease domain-containing protein [Gaiellaceae bacterium]|nr:M6 family metalloprotease domain-containing protein [Gaiellaceae bacterium]